MSRWFYAKRGNVRLHGVADELTLGQMLRRGELRAHDLVWKLEDGTGWLPLSRSGICVAEDVPAEPVVAAVAPDQGHDADNRSTSEITFRLTPRLMRLLEILAVLVFLQVVMLLLREPLSRVDLAVPAARAPVIVAERPAVTPEEAAEIEAENLLQGTLTSLRSRIRQSLERQDVATASRLIVELHQQLGDTPEVTDYLTSLAVLRTALGRMEAWHAKLLDGTLAEDDAENWAEIAQRYRRERHVRAQVDRVLDDTDNLSPSRAIAAFFVSRSIGDLARAQRALNIYERMQPPPESYAQLEALLSLYTGSGFVEDAIRSLEQFLERYPNSTAAWLEYGALQAQAGDSRGAVSSVRNAVRHGGTAAKQRARDDPRFDPVRESWGFRRATRF